MGDGGLLFLLILSRMQLAVQMISGPDRTTTAKQRSMKTQNSPQINQNDTTTDHLGQGAAFKKIDRQISLRQTGFPTRIPPESILFVTCLPEIRIDGKSHLEEKCYSLGPVKTERTLIKDKSFLQGRYEFKAQQHFGGSGFSVRHRSTRRYKLKKCNRTVRKCVNECS